VALVGALAFSGCLTLDPSLTANTTNSSVFEDFSVSESWATNKIPVETTLTSTPAAGNVTTITVIQKNGRTFSTHQIESGQTRVILSVPPNQNATLVASNSVNSTTIEKINVSTTGNKLF
jgi:hypothetical protein